MNKELIVEALVHNETSAPLPEWFPKVRFFSAWEKDAYIEKTLNPPKR